MKKFLKFLGLTALAAALIPYRVEKDEETGEKSYDALLWHARARGNLSDEPDGRKVDVTFGLKTPEEREWVDCDDDLDDIDWDNIDDGFETDTPDPLEIEIDDADLAGPEPEIPED